MIGRLNIENKLFELSVTVHFSIYLKNPMRHLKNVAERHQSAQPAYDLWVVPKIPIVQLHLLSLRFIEKSFGLITSLKFF